MSEKTKQRVSLIICALGFMIILFAAGASDLDLISFKQIVIRVLIGSAMVFGGAFSGGIFQ